jgi:hypothetical protein
MSSKASHSSAKELVFSSNPCLQCGRCILIALFILLTPSLRSAPIAGIYDTGVKNDGTLATGGSVDLHYSLISKPNSLSATAYVVSTRHPKWYQPTTNAWISPNANATVSQPIGIYTYRFTFALVDATARRLDPATANLSGKWAVDNDTVIFLNGIKVATNSDHKVLTPFAISSGFVIGTNTLEIVVTNTALPDPDTLNPTGFIISDFVGSAQVVQEPVNLTIERLSASMRLEVRGTIGSTYRIEYSQILPTQSWSNLTTINLTASPSYYLDSTSITNDAQRFYRTVLVP